MADHEVEFTALVATLMFDGASTMHVLDEPMPELRAFVLGDAPFERAAFTRVLHELHIPAALRMGAAIMHHAHTGQIMVAHPHKPTEDEIVRAFDDLVARANSLVSAPPACGDALDEQIASIVGDFLLLHPYVDGNGRIAEALLAALVRRTRPDGLVVCIGTHGGTAYSNWCNAVASYQLERDPCSMIYCIMTAVGAATDLRTLHTR